MLHALLVGSLVLGASQGFDLHRDYANAYRAAKKTNQMFLLDMGVRLDFAKLDSSRLGGYVLCQLPLDATVNVDGEDVKLVDHSSFAELGGEPGVLIIDLQNDQYLGDVVSVLPNRHMNLDHLYALLDLPHGTLTQRTLIWALRVHPERPQSVWGTPDPALVNHAANHSQAQASSNTQYHNMPLGISSSEIVAESWPWNRNVVDAALDIVNSWRQSAGHWGAACRPYSYFGYDMKKNGSKWFATGVFR